MATWLYDGFPSLPTGIVHRAGNAPQASGGYLRATPGWFTRFDMTGTSPPSTSAELFLAVECEWTASSGGEFSLMFFGDNTNGFTGSYNNYVVRQDGTTTMETEGGGSSGSSHTATAIGVHTWYVHVNAGTGLYRAWVDTDPTVVGNAFQNNTSYSSFRHGASNHQIGGYMQEPTRWSKWHVGAAADGWPETTPSGTVAVTLDAFTSSVSATHTPPPTPYVVTATSAAISASRSPSVTFGTAAATGDVVVMFPSSTGTGVTVTAPSGWVNVLGGSTDVESDSHHLGAAYHIVTSGEVGTTTWTMTNWFGVAQTGAVTAALVRNIDTSTPIDSANSTFSSTNSASPHVLASLTGANLSTGSLVLSSVAKDGTGAYSTQPTGWTFRTQLDTNQGVALLSRDAFTTASSDVTATNITPSAGDEYASITVALMATVTGSVAATLGDFTSAIDASHTPPTAEGTVAVTLDPFTSAATGIVAVMGTVDATLGAFTSTASAVFGDYETFLAEFTTSADLALGSMANFRTQYDDEVNTNDGQDTTMGHGPDVPDNITVTSGRLRIESGMQNYGESTWRSNTQWTGAGTIEFDVVGDSIAGTDWSGENRTVLLITDRPYAFTSIDGDNANGPKPAYGIGFYSQAPANSDDGMVQARTWEDYVQTMHLSNNGSGGPPNGRYTAGVSQHWVISISGGSLHLEIDGVDAETGTGGLVPVPTGMSLVGSWITLGTHNHASIKYDPFVATVANDFDNLEYEALLVARAAEVPAAAGPERFGWHLEEDGGTAPIVHETTELALGTATDGWLVLNVGADRDAVDSASRLHYSLNGNTEHEVPYQLDEHTVFQVFSFSIPVDVEELVQGVNEVEVWQSGAFAGAAASSMRYANVQLVVEGGTGDPPPVDLVVADATHGHTVDSPTLTQAHNLTVADAAHGHAADSVTLTQAHTLVVADALHGLPTDSPTLTQVHTLVVADALHGHTADNVTLVTTDQLVVQDALHGHTVDGPTLTQTHVLTVADALHGLASDNIALTQAHTLAAVADALHGHAADNVALTQGHVLTVAEALHSQSADSVTLTQAHVLVVADALHGHTVDGPLGLSGEGDVVPNDATHGHSVDSPTLTQVHNLTVQDALHAHSVDNVALTQTHVIVVADALHGHTADNVVLVSSDTLVVQDALHALTSDNVVLAAGAVLVVAETLHAHSADNVILTQVHVLVVADATHVHRVDNVALPGEFIPGHISGEWLMGTIQGEWATV